MKLTATERMILASKEATKRAKEAKKQKFEEILQCFPVNVENSSVKAFGNGLINNTYVVETDRQQYVLQKINTTVFTKPEIIASNLELAGKYLSQKAPNYLFLNPIKTVDNKPYAILNDAYYRLTPFVENSHSFDTIEKPEHAFMAAKAFGKLTKQLDGINTQQFEATIPDFHNLSYRFHQFTQSIDRATTFRKQKATNLIANFLSKKNIVTTYEELINNPQMPTRILHHDTKINNVLFDKTTGEAVAVCDLDTLMPGLIISDIGDMFRTSLSPLPEDATDYENIVIREEIYEAIYNGYLTELADVLTETEIKYLNFGGEFMIYMQGIRFLTDYLNGDTYYLVKHPKHNFERATNQWTLLKAFQEFVERK